MNTLSKRFYDFASFRVDLTERKLWRAGEIVPLRPKLFDLLVVLIENRGRALQREELFKAVWGELSMGDVETHGAANLSVNISALRRVLGDDLEKPAYIETSPRQGYRFIAEVREWEEGTAAGDLLPLEKSTKPKRSWFTLHSASPRHSGLVERFRRSLWLALPLLAVLTLVSVRFVIRPGTDFAPPPLFFL